MDGPQPVFALDLKPSLNLNKLQAGIDGPWWGFPWPSLEMQLIITFIFYFFQNKNKQQTNSSCYLCAGTLKFKDPLRPCCEAVSTGYKCGNTEHGKRMYVVCNNPNSTFFWDDVHPSQAGWRAVYLALKSSAYSLALMQPCAF